MKISVYLYRDKLESIKLSNRSYKLFAEPIVLIYKSDFSVYNYNYLYIISY